MFVTLTVLALAVLMIAWSGSSRAARSRGARLVASRDRVQSRPDRDRLPGRAQLGRVAAGPPAVVGRAAGTGRRRGRRLRRVTFIYYWWHRSRHEATFLWRWFHQFHHSPQRIEIITSFYKHPLELIANGILSSAILYGLVGLGREGRDARGHC